MRKLFPRRDEPTAADLAAIEAEESLTAAEVAWTDAEIRLLVADERGGPTDLDWRRLRRAEALVIRETFAYVARMTRSTAPRRAA